MILQANIPYDVFAPRPLPGIMPLGNQPWFIVDEVYAAQVAQRRDLASSHPDAVLAIANPDPAALDEMMTQVLAHLPDGFVVSDDSILCPDGVSVPLNRDAPFDTLCRVLQEDICLLEKRGDEHVLTGAALCFPASWRLAEKIGRPLTQIHIPVSEYTEDIARRVQRLFDGVRPGRAIWRFNALWYEDPTLHQPRTENSPRQVTERGTTPYLRSERQVIWRLPESGAALFTIHTFVLPRAAVAFPERSGSG